jgi:hypothetical protein
LILGERRDSRDDVFDGKVRTDEEGDWVSEGGMLADGEKLHRAVVADFLEDLEFAGFFAEDNEALGAEDFFGKSGEEFFENFFRDQGREWNFA